MSSAVSSTTRRNDTGSTSGPLPLRKRLIPSNAFFCSALMYSESVEFCCCCCSCEGGGSDDCDVGEAVISSVVIGECEGSLIIFV